MTSARHLILGASHGLGYAYAQIRAEEGGDLTLVGRNTEDLEQAQESLSAAGAARVSISPGDLLDSEFRTRLRKSLDGLSFQTLLVGGPSPPAGTLEEVTAEDLRLASHITLRYPFEFLEWGLGPGIVEGGTVYVIGSSASQEPLCDHSFFLSALLRRCLDDLAECFRSRYQHRNKKLSLWRPRVVLTRLSLRFAQHLAASSKTSTPGGLLAQYFSETPMEATLYVRQSI